MEIPVVVISLPMNYTISIQLSGQIITFPYKYLNINILIPEPT